MNKFFLGTSLCFSVLLTACATQQSKMNVGMANPASVYCEKIGGSSTTKKDVSGNEVGYCTLPDGTVIDEWKLYRSAHQENQQNLIISYDLAKKQNVLTVIEAQNMQIIYDLKNMNIIVVSIPKSDIQESTKYLEKVDGVLGVQEDTKMELH